MHKSSRLAAVVLMSLTAIGCHRERVSAVTTTVRVEYPGQAICVGVPIERGSEWSGPGPFPKLYDINGFKNLARYDRFVRVGWRRDFASNLAVMLLPYTGGEVSEEAVRLRALRLENMVSRLGAEIPPGAFGSMDFGTLPDNEGREWTWHSGYWGANFWRRYYLRLDFGNGPYLAVVAWSFEPIEFDKTNFETRRDRISRVLSSVSLC